MTLWIGLISFIGAVVLIDLYAIHRGHVRPTNRSEWRTFTLYIVLACVFAGFLYGLYDDHWMGLGVGRHGEVARTGHEAAVEFLTAFAWQLALGLDSVFIIAALFSRFKTPDNVMHRVLLWGVLLALVVRAALVLSGAWMLRLEWTRFLLSGLLILAALRMLLMRQENLDPSKNVVLSLMARVLPVTDRIEGNALLTRVGGRLAVTRLLILVILLETADAFLALDAIPAGLAISRDSFLVFAASAFALLCLRTIYVVLAGYTNWLRYVKIGLASSLAYAAVLMALPKAQRPDTLWSLAVLLLSLGAGLVLSIGAKRAAAPDETPIIGTEAEALARQALSHARRIIALVLGVSLLAVGLFFVLAPGPGLPIVFIGLAVLGNEFAWARRLTARYRDRAAAAVESSSKLARRRFRPWVIIPIIAFTVAFFVAGGMYLKAPPMGVALACLFPILGQLGWWYATFFFKPPPNPESQPPDSEPRT